MKIRNTLNGAKNIGTTIEKRLNEIGIYTLADLAERSPKKAYQDICEQHLDKTIPKCYYLYALQGALMDVDWRALPKKIKKELQE